MMLLQNANDSTDKTGKLEINGGLCKNIIIVLSHINIW